jgi:hypothetical protein
MLEHIAAGLNGWSDSILYAFVEGFENEDVESKTCRTFYLFSGVLVFACWGIMSITTGHDFHARCKGYAIATRPTLVPKDMLLRLNPNYCPLMFNALCHGLPVLLVYCAVATPVDAMGAGRRIIIATWMSLYQLAESSVTHSHRDFTNMYLAWGFVASPIFSKNGDNSFCCTFALFACAIMLAGSGLAKVCIGGLYEWAQPNTLMSILESYGERPRSIEGPGLLVLNKVLSNKSSAFAKLSVGMLGLATIMFEIVIVPLSLFLPSLRVPVFFASILLHLGIMVSQSLVIGVAFLPNCAAYWIAFLAPGAAVNEGLVTVGTVPFEWVMWAWFGLWISLLAFGTNRGVLPEDWPCTPFALFPWNGGQWNAMFKMFASQEEGCMYRLILIADASLLGTWHDGHEQCFGETLVYAELVPALNKVFPLSSKLESLGVGNKQMETFVCHIAEWLQLKKRLIDVKTGRFLQHAAYVKLNPDSMSIERVIAVSFDHKKNE